MSDAPGRLKALRDHAVDSVQAAGLPIEPALTDLLDRAEGWLARTPQLPVRPGGTLPLSLEASATLTARGLEPRRYIVGLPARGLGGDPLRHLRNFAELFDLPARAHAWLDRLRAQGELPGAVHLGLAAGPAGWWRRIYLERRPLGRVLHEHDGLGPWLAMVGLEWPEQEPARPLVRTYAETLEDSPLAVVPALELDRPQASAALATLRERTALQHVWIREDRDVGDPARDAYLHLHPLPLGEVHDVLAELAVALALPVPPLRAWLERMPAGTQLRVLGLGLGRDRAPRLKIYHGPAPEHLVEAAAEVLPDLRDLPGAVVLEVARLSDNAKGTLVILPPGAPPPRRPALTTPRAQAFLLGALDGQVDLQPWLEGLGEGPLTTTVSQALPALADGLATVGWHLRGLTARFS